MASFIFMAYLPLCFSINPLFVLDPEREREKDRMGDALSAILVFAQLCLPKSINLSLAFLIHFSLLVLHS